MRKGYAVMRVVDFRVCYRQIDGSYSPELGDRTDIKDQRERCFQLARAERGLTVFVEAKDREARSSNRAEIVHKINSQPTQDDFNKIANSVRRQLVKFRKQMALK